MTRVTHVLGRYELLLPIASGGMATVWAARLRGSRGFQKIVAVKTILPKLTEDPEFEQMFLDEASLASQIRHPHVVEILDLGEQEGVLYLVMEWIEGLPMNEVMREARKRGGVPLPVAVRIGMQACAGLHAAHELRNPSGELVGLVHRDVSPQNILVTYDGVTKVVDFGIAKATALGGGSTGVGRVKGKVGYMAPEQATGAAIDRRVDVFAIGIFLYSLTTGRHPFRGESEADTVARICSDKPALPPSEIVPGYPVALERVLLQALAKDPAKRSPTANDILRGLDQALPASMRASSDEDVAAFVRGIFSERREQSRTALAAALEQADARAGGAASAEGRTRQVSLRQLLSARSPDSASPSDASGSTGAAVAHSAPTHAGAPSHPGASENEAGPAGTLGAQVAALPLRRKLVVAAALAMAVLLGGVALLLATRSTEKPALEPSATGVPPAAGVSAAPIARASREPLPQSSAPAQPSVAASSRPPSSTLVPATGATSDRAPRSVPARPRAAPSSSKPSSWRHDPGF